MSSNNTPESPSARPRVAVVYGSASDAQTMSKAGATLARFGVAHEEAVLSAHRAPRTLADWVEGLRGRGIQVVIAGAGLAAALPGTVAALTTLPVIGVPISGGALDGMDSMLAIAQMPPGVAVATVGLNNATNAAVLAVQILALADQELAGKLATYKDDFERAAADGLARVTAAAAAPAGVSA
ncbi:MULTISPECIES: 5-(carboxyamino)imidazole ribonucleotide mutase [Pseudofrankia]|uniref:5-(carboxyamino)imidazole ribonucleotide mutase n=1 Tax=Pseudofrankia TaxID=2994363 RepID=UPI0002F8BF68|nr:MULTISPECIES: 5-(carboxyamino)imidazole ribonucleotide mutase [Pseudofrankia]OHV39850.1 5-(carboxyamino)imidazole ribonucleotide mutase [Pseudofrankia sp. EUN1h]